MQGTLKEMDISDLILNQSLFEYFQQLYENVVRDIQCDAEETKNMRYIISSMMFVHLESYPAVVLKSLKDFLPHISKAALDYFDENIQL